MPSENFNGENKMEIMNRRRQRVAIPADFFIRVFHLKTRFRNNCKYDAMKFYYAKIFIRNVSATKAITGI